MSVKLSTFDRRMEIFFILLGGRIISRQELARRFDVDRTAIHRDITALSRYIPISSKMGRYGGIYLTGNLSVPRVYLSEAEKDLIAGLMKNVSNSKKVILQNILDKFSHPKKNIS